MKQKKDCVFQYATDDGEVWNDTALISRADAEALWQQNIEVFRMHLEQGRGPEMAIWVDMANDSDFHTMAAHWDSSNIVLRDGDLYRLERLG